MKTIQFTSIILILLFCSFTPIVTSTEDIQNDCKAIINDEIVAYEGDCRKGFAHGQGKTVGDEYYEGRFKKGRPHGFGTFYYANGNTFEGGWSNGMKDGEGKLVMKRLNAPDSILTGFWKRDKYLGESKPQAAYKVTRNEKVRRYRIEKVNDVEPAVEIRITRNAARWSSYSNFVMLGNPGVQYAAGTQMGYKDVNFPFTGAVSMTVPNLMGSNNYPVYFEFTITEPGRWTVTIDV